MKKKILVILCVLICSNLYSQDFITIRGIIQSGSDTIRVPYVSIYIEKTGIGTMSNENGIFEFHVPCVYENDMVCFTSIGYESTKVFVSKFGKEVNTIFMRRDTINVPEVIVLGPGVTPKSILENAIKQIPENYSRKQCYYDAFYREMALDLNVYARLIEAAVEIQDFGFDAEDSRRKIKVVEMRKSEDYIKRDFFTKLKVLFFSEDNELTMLVDRFDYVGAIYTKKKVLLNDFTHEMVGMTKYEGKEVYIIESKQRIWDMFDDYMKFYINKEDLAFVQIEYRREFSAMVKDKYPDFYKENNNVNPNKSITKYIKTGDHYYLNFIKSVIPFSLQPPAQNSKSMQGQSFYKELMINNVYSNRDEYERIKNRDVLQKDKDLYKQEYIYNPSFWENYNVLLINPLLKKAEADLAKETELEKQFIKNGNH